MHSVTSKYHKHFSTTRIRRSIGRYQKGKGTYMCQICCELESVIIPATETRRVVLACSTMYGIWKNKLPASTEHFDMDSIVGGTVKDMMRALVKNYLYFGQGFGPVWTSEDPPRSVRLCHRSVLYSLLHFYSNFRFPLKLRWQAMWSC